MGVETLVDAQDLLEAAAIHKSQVLAQANAGRPLDKLDRHLRLELLSMDSVVPLDTQGEILAAGEIMMCRRSPTAQPVVALAKWTDSSDILVPEARAVQVA